MLAHTHSRGTSCGMLVGSISWGRQFCICLSNNVQSTCLFDTRDRIRLAKLTEWQNLGEVRFLPSLTIRTSAAESVARRRLPRGRLFYARENNCCCAILHIALGLTLP